MENLTIGQMAKLNHISEQTLRLYDKIGLLSPCRRDESNGYRYYDIRQSAQLDMIQYMKSLGMNLKEIKKQLDCSDMPSIKDILSQRKNQMDHQIKELEYQKRAIDRTVESLERYECSPSDGSIVLEYIPKRQIYYIDSGINFYDYGIATYEKILRELKESLIADKLPQIYFCNAGSILRQDDLVNRLFVSTEVFVFVDKEFVTSEVITTIPPNNYICIYCDGFHKEKEYAIRLLDEIDRKGYRINGDYLCEVISEAPIVEKNERGMFLRLQIPIKYC
ncbi:MAG TPA: MerR family transcriptional regulator [Lachnoclostridium phytofermentans]|uniref:MerR family transcriptional regulator n=1 Tax=Lachnoclostridium phytofermentans TaxID=66219 RepID=A0A3D2X6R8_9FIRM|nr:helix-turn-helix domain-containing protein [Lachnoclostridium sp.]HCL02840.1 MerR family transcriptional regulator [Lachnoclostridium phytofermentans]